MGVFEAETVPLFTYESAQRLENTFIQKPTPLPLELSLRPTTFIQPTRNETLPIILIGAISIISVVGLFLAFFSTRRG